MNNTKLKLLWIAVLFMGLAACEDSTEQKINLFMIGDSTMANKAENRAPETGWGMIFQDFFKERLSVHNHARNGRSSKSFIGEGLWQEVYEQLKPGDYVFIQFGHNDQKEKSPDRFTNPLTTFRANLKYYVQACREKGARPVLFTPVVRRNFNENGTLIDTHGLYPLVTRMTAGELDVPCIDLQLLTEQLVTRLGPEDSKQLYLWLNPGEHANYPEGSQDNTHFNLNGARQVGEMVVGELKRLHLLENYLQEQARP
ncbi:MAG: rhamnogalacturonan acetylesterase [Mangrovibacterium sp.]